MPCQSLTISTLLASLSLEQLREALNEAEIHRLRLLLLDLRKRREPPPARGRGFDWRFIATYLEVEPARLEQARSSILPALKLLRDVHHNPPSWSRRKLRLTRYKAEAPAPLFDVWDEPDGFAEALDLHMRRHRETSYALWRAITDGGETFEASTLVSWRKGRKAPRSVDSLRRLVRIEQRYALPAGYFAAKLPHRGRALVGHIVPARSSERRRLAWHLPNDFDERPAAERQQILQWVRDVIISGNTDYRRWQRVAIQDRYSVKFLDAPADEDLTAPRPEGQGHRPVATAALAEEMRSLLAFKTSVLTTVGMQRRGVWGSETAAQKLEHLSLMLGALCASSTTSVKGRGVPIADVGLAILAFPAIWDWYVEWRRSRRGFYTVWEVDMLAVAASLTGVDTGWLTQTPSLAQRLVPIAGLISDDDIATARSDWPAQCALAHRHVRRRAKEIERVARVHRDPFEPILPVLEAESPVAEYRKITDEILRLMPDERRYPKSTAESVRALLMFRFGLHLGLRQKNLRQLLLCSRSQTPSSERRLDELRRGELRWSDRNSGWEVVIPASAFKNADSSFFGGKPFRLMLPNLRDLYFHIDRYVDLWRPLLLGGAADPGTFFVKTAKRSTANAAFDQTGFYEAWRLTTQRYGVFNPFTGRGAIAGLLPHGPHNVRDVLATHILKTTGSFEQASYAIQDTPEIVAKHYGRFLPENKAALAATILNRAWEDG